MAIRNQVQAERLAVLVNHKVLEYDVGVLVGLGKPAVQSIDWAHGRVPIVDSHWLVVVSIFFAQVEGFVNVVKKLNLLDILILLGKFNAIDMLVRGRATAWVELFFNETAVAWVHTIQTDFQAWALLRDSGPWHFRENVHLFFVHLLSF